MATTLRLLIAAALLALAMPATAHKPSDAYLTLDRSQAPNVLRVDIALQDLARAVSLDRNGDGAITWAELSGASDSVNALVAGASGASANGRSCPLEPLTMAVAEHTDGAYAALGFAVRCADGAAVERLEYNLFFDRDPLHRGLLAVNDDTTATAVIFSPDRRTIALPEQPGLWSTIRDFTWQGVWHIWIGFDHILFLLVLLLPAAVVGTGFRGSFMHTLKVVTAFTLAHSVTLTLAVLGIVTLPAGPVEVGIAASIILVALANLVPAWRRFNWGLAFALGLLHGLGFAGVLTDLGLPAGALIPALVSFNVGVEIGQLVIVALVLPLLYGLRRTGFYARGVIPAGSLAAATVAGIWVVERLA